MAVLVIFNRVSRWQSLTGAAVLDGRSNILTVRTVTRPCCAANGSSKWKLSGGTSKPASPNPLNFKKSRRDKLFNYKTYLLVYLSTIFFTNNVHSPQCRPMRNYITIPHPVWRGWRSRGSWAYRNYYASTCRVVHSLYRNTLCMAHLLSNTRDQTWWLSAIWSKFYNCRSRSAFATCLWKPQNY